MSNTNNVGVEVCVPTPMVFGFFFPPDLPPILETPLVFQRHVSVATLSGRGDIKLKALWSRYGKSTRPEKRNGGKEIRPLDFCWWLKMVVVVVALGKNLFEYILLQHLQPLGMDRWKLVVFLYKAFFSGCITLCLYSSVCSAFIKRLSQLVLRIALSLVSLCSLISILAIGQCMATANTLPCISCPFVWFSVFL